MEYWEWKFKDTISNARIVELANIIDSLSKDFINNSSIVLRKYKDFSKIKDKYEIFKNLFVYTIKQIETNKELQEENIIQCSIYLGTMLEGSLQIFLLAYNQDFLSSHWREWKEEDTKKLKEKLFKYLNQLVEEEIINSKQRDSLKDTIKTEIKLHKNRNVDRIMLDELIAIYRKQNILISSNEEKTSIYDMLEEIKNGRNSIHIFTKCKKNTYQELKKFLENYCFIIDDLSRRIEVLIEDE